MSKLAPCKISTYEKTRAEKFIDPDGKFPHFSDIATEGLRLLIDQLEEKEAQKK